MGSPGLAESMDVAGSLQDANQARSVFFLLPCARLRGVGLLLLFLSVPEGLGRNGRVWQSDESYFAVTGPELTLGMVAQAFARCKTKRLPFHNRSLPRGAKRSHQKNKTKKNGSFPLTVLIGV